MKSLKNVFRRSFAGALTFGLFCVQTCCAEIWVSGQRVADADAPVVQGEWHGGFKSCLDEANRTHTPLVAVFSSEWGGCPYCVKFKEAANTDLFRDWMKDSGCLFLYMACDYPNNENMVRGNGYSGFDSDAWKWIQAGGGSVNNLGSIRVYWNVDDKKVLTTAFTYFASPSDSDEQTREKTEAMIRKCEDCLTYNLTLSNDVHRVVTYGGFGNSQEIVTVYTYVWVTGVKDDTVSVVRIPRYATHIGPGAFANMWDLDNVVIPDGIETIGERAFENCSLMQTITFGKGLKKIGKNAFKGCTQLQKVVFQDGLCEIEDGAFDGCWRLQSVSLPVSVSNVAETAFTGCSNLRGVTTPTHCGTMSSWFKPIYTQIKDVTIAAGELKVGDGMFAGCSALENVAFADSKDGVRTIGNCAFQDCVKLSGLTLPESLSEVWPSAFKGCTALTAIVLPSGVSWIGSSVFENCSALKDVTLSQSLSAIPDRAFYGCDSLDSFTVPESVSYLGSQIVSGSSSWYSSPGTSAIYFLGDAPSYASDVYGSARSDLTSYVVAGTRGWDGRPMSRDIPQQWPTDTAERRGILTWSPNPFDVTFDAAGGLFANDGSQTYACQQITYTAYALPPYNPTRSGYIFDGWWTERTGGTQVTPSVRVTLMKAHTLYAHWTVAGVIRVRFNATGGTVTPESGSYRSGEPYGELPVPTREYWDFDGWWTQTAGGVKVVAASEVPTADVELFAHWVPATYRIVFHAENGSTYSNTRTQTFRYGDTVTLWANEWSCGSATFGGWALEPGGRAVYADKKTLSDLSDVRDGELHLYAVWIGDTYAVRFDSNGGTGYMYDQTMVLGVTYNLNANCFVRSGYAFQGWSLSPSGTRQYSDGERVYGGFPSASRGSTVVLYAVWRAKGVCTVTFNPQGGTCGETRRSVAEGDEIGMLPVPTRSGYVFLCWTDGPSGGSVLSESTKIYYSRTYYALWDRAPEQTYAVTFDAQGGICWESSRSVKSGKTIGTLPTPTRSKCKFNGWYTAAEGGTKISSATKVTADVTYYAHWQYDGQSRVDVKVTDDCADMGMVSGGKSAKAGTKVTLKATAKPGYVFAGWYQDAEGWYPVEGETDYRSPNYAYVVGEDDVTFYARFIPADEDDVDVYAWVDEEYGRGVAIEPIWIDVYSESLPTIKVTGLPTGLKFTNKRIVSKWGLIEAEANTIYGTPTKSGVYTVTVTATTAGKQTGSRQFRMVVRSANEYVVSAKGVYRCPLTACCCDYTPSLGAVSGNGVYAFGKKVTLMAPAAPKGQVFAGWYVTENRRYADDENWWGDPPEDFFEVCAPVVGDADYRNPTLSVTAGLVDCQGVLYADDFACYALYMYGEFDTELRANVESDYYLNGPWSLKLDIESRSLPTVSVKGLPSGLKFNAKTLTISGTPTKPGTYPITLSLKNKTITKARTQTFALHVANIESPYLVGVDYSSDAYAYSVGSDVRLDIGSCVRGGYSISGVSGLPKGVSYNKATEMIEGCPTQEGAYTVSISLKNGRQSSKATLTMNVSWIEENFSLRLYRHVAVRETLSFSRRYGDGLSFAKTQGTLPSGVKISADALQDCMMIEGVPTSAGTFRTIYTLNVQKGGKRIPCARIVLQLEVLDPAQEGSGAFGEALNASCAKARTFNDLMILDDGGSGRMIGVLTLTLPPTGKASGKLVCKEGTLSFSAKSWSAISADDGRLLVTLACAFADCRLEVEANRDGSIRVVFFDGMNAAFPTEHSGRLWDRTYSADAYAGYYTVSLRNEGIDGPGADYAPTGSGYLTLKMKSAAEINAGKMIWAGSLPNGQSISGSSVLSEFEGGLAVLPFAKGVSYDWCAGAMGICNGQVSQPHLDGFGAVKTIWEHVEKSRETTKGDYSISFEPIGGL